MRKVFEHPNFHEVGLCQSILNSHDIATTIKNQDVSSLSGEVPFASAFPELWVLDDSTYDKAVGLLRDWAALLVILVPIFAAFIRRMNVEEDALSRALGARYAEYMRRTKRLLPFVY